jgi:hypothetical protein
MPLRTLLALALCIGIVTLTSCASAIDINPPQWSRSFNSTWYQRGQVLDPNQYVLYWSVNKPLGEIQFGVVAKTSTSMTQFPPTRMSAEYRLNREIHNKTPYSCTSKTCFISFKRLTKVLNLTAPLCSFVGWVWPERKWWNERRRCRRAHS